MSRILLRSGKDPFTPVSAEATLAQDVMNTNVGNYLFQHAVHRSLSVPGAEIVSNSTLSETRPATEEEIARVNEEFDLFVVPLANAFRPEFAERLANLTSLVRGLRIPVVVVGVGAQTTADLDGGPLAPLAAGVKDFVSAVLDRSSSIGVRGDFTRSYLSDLGFRGDQVTVIGCPSLFLRGEGFSLPAPGGRLTAASRIAVNVTPGVPHLGAFLKANLDRYPGLRYLGQDRADLELLLWARDPAVVDPDLPLHTAHRMYREDRVLMYLDGWSWIEDLATYDFAFGTRFHGNVAAVLAGTRAVLLTHDSRTVELADYHELPRRRVSDLTTGGDVAELFESCDVGPFNKAYPDRLARYAAFLDGNGLPHVHDSGADAEEFDRRVTSVHFPGPVRSLWAADPDGLGHRLGWLYEGQVLEAERHRDRYQHPFNHPEYRDTAARRAEKVAAANAKLRAQLADDRRAITELTSRLARYETRLAAVEQTWPRRLRRKLGAWRRRLGAPFARS